jgi:hypothetical protein
MVHVIRPASDLVSVIQRWLKCLLTLMGIASTLRALFPPYPDV